MPVVATPVTTTITQDDCPVFGTGAGGNIHSELPTPVASCLNQKIVVLETPLDSVTGKPVPERIRNITVPSGVATEIRWQMLDDKGRIVDLSECACTSQPCPYSYSLMLCDYFGCQPHVCFDSVVYDAGTNTLKANANIGTGVYAAEMVVFFTDPLHPLNIENTAWNAANPTEPPKPLYRVPIFVNRFFLTSERTVLNRDWTENRGPLSFAEIRLALRDSGAVENRLLQTVRFSDEEMVLAMSRPVLYWNEIPPEIGSYDLRTFPYRYHWLQGTIGYLMLMLSEYQRANQLEYSAGGLSVRDQSAFMTYAQAAELYISQYKAFVRQKKTQLNMQSGFGSVSSQFDTRARFLGGR